MWFSVFVLGISTLIIGYAAGNMMRTQFRIEQPENVAGENPSYNSSLGALICLYMMLGGNLVVIFILLNSNSIFEFYIPSNLGVFYLVNAVIIVYLLGVLLTFFASKHHFTFAIHFIRT